MLLKLTGVDVGLEELALTCKAVPAVLNTTPLGEVTLKKSEGKSLGAAKALGTPSQLISRLPVPKEPGTFVFKVPRSVRNWSTTVCMADAFAPLPLLTN